MPGRWSDERDWEGGHRNWRAREDDDERGFDSYPEGRSFDDDAPRYQGEGADRVFGERDTGAQYNERNPRMTGGYGRETFRRETHGRGSRGRDPYDYDYGRRPAWQDRDYEGVSPAMRQGEYELDRNRRARFGSNDYTRGGGRFYGDDSRGRVFREDYGGHDYDSGYRSYEERRDDRREPFEERARDAGDFMRRTGQRISSWFQGATGDMRRDLFDEPRGHRGRGPKGYQRADDRISDEAHQRLTDDPWVDASEISISVSSGEVTLSGTVESREAKHRAERVVEDISGVKHVQNNLRVERGNFFTRPTPGFGDSASEAQMRGETTGNGDAATRTTTRRT